MILIGREMLSVDGLEPLLLLLFASLADTGDIGPEEEEELTLPGGGKRSLLVERLALRPREAKKPVLLVDGVETRERMEEGGVPLPTLELDRAGWVLLRSGFKAKDGYGRVDATVAGVMSP